MLSGPGLCIFMVQGARATADHGPGATNATEIAASASLPRRLLAMTQCFGIATAGRGSQKAVSRSRANKPP